MEILNAIVLFHGVVFPSDISNFGGCYMTKTIYDEELAKKLICLS